MIRLTEAVVVEGRYDKIRLSGLVDALIIVTDGFAIFKDAQKMELLKRLAETRGLIILTDSDSAGFLIRSHIRGCITAGRVVHAYIPDLYGKERRKTAPGKEGKLGVEGMSTETLLKTLEMAGVTPVAERLISQPITRADFYELGFTGRTHSAVRRQELLKKLDLPERLSFSALCEIINDLIGRDELSRLAGEIEESDNVVE